MLLRVLTLVAITAKFLVGTSGQATTTAQCLSSFSWMSNSKGQSPCLVASYLQSVCNNGEWGVTALPLGTHYTGPDKTEINTCQCSTVTYSTVSACGICQNRTAETWSAWSSNCTTIYPKLFPENIPAGTTVPDWAYMDVITPNIINITAMEADTNAPESTGIEPAGPTATGASSSASSGTSTGPSPGSKKSSHAGAIAGGVVGGLVGLGLITAVIVMLVVRRSRAHRAPSAAYDSDGHSHIPINSSPPMSQSPPKLYDPLDPSTFPSTVPSTTMYSTDGGSARTGPPGHYNFAPEL